VAICSSSQYCTVNKGLKGRGTGQVTSAGFRALGSGQSLDLFFDLFHFEDLCFRGMIFETNIGSLSLNESCVLWMSSDVA
jgi:hypothetical protein